MVDTSTFDRELSELHVLARNDDREATLESARKLATHYGASLDSETATTAFQAASAAVCNYDLELATQYAIAAVHRRRSMPNPVALASSINLLGCIQFIRGEPAYAFELFADALSIYRTAGNVIGIARVLYNRANALEKMGRDEEAEQEYEVSIRMYHEANSSYGVVLAQCGIALVFANRHEDAKAKELFAKVLKSPDIPELLRKSVLTNMALLRSRSGEVFQALQDVQEIFGGVDPLTSDMILVSELMRYGTILSNAGQHDQAMLCLQKAVARSESEAKMQECMLVCEEASRVFEKGGDVKGALHYLRRYVEFREILQREDRRIGDIDARSSRRLIQADILTLEYPSLSQTEANACVLFSEGQSTKDVAIQLHLSVRTVETLRQRATKKFALKSSRDLNETLRSVLVSVAPR